MSSLSLLEIQRLQFTSKEDAARALHAFLLERGVSDVTGVEINPKPESLNSVNGFVQLAGGERLFFKTHVEEEEKLGEYYRGQFLLDAGYPVVQPERVRSVPGEQIVFYRPITYPTLFDLVKAAEDEGRTTGSSANGARLIGLQRSLDRRIAELYQSTAVRAVTGVEEDAAPIYQLFTHRLRSDGRYGLFYDEGSIEWNGKRWPCRELFAKQWVINGISFPTTIDSQVVAARTALAPAGAHAMPIVTVIGHGDAHNGNVFVDEQGGRLLYFDPAFAGRHEIIADLVKPLFHNIFARWMYHPIQVEKEFSLTARITEDRIELEHDFTLSPLRRAFFDSKIDLLLPTVGKLLQQHGIDREYWSARLHSMLLCCPLLTVNLAATPDTTGPLGSRYPSAIRMLALALAIEVGARPAGGQTAISSLIDSVDRTLHGD